MKRFYIAVCAAVLVASCGHATPVGTHRQTLEEHLENPLFAEQYSEQLVDRLTMLEINQDPMLEDNKVRKKVEKAKLEWLEVARAARKQQREGVYGGFAYVDEFVDGEVALIGDHLYMAPSFTSDPGVDVHLYLTELIDPRESDFPDETSVDLGKLRNPYGAHSYDLSGLEVPLEPLRTVVLWDRGLERLYGFVQLHR